MNRAIAVLAVCGILLVLTHGQGNAKQYQATPVQTYNAQCLAEGNAYPCTLIR